MKITFITLLPEVINQYISSSMMYKASKIGAVEFKILNLRDFGLGPRKTVDDTPYGGGDGMLLMIEPLYNAITAAKVDSPDAMVILPTPRGQLFKQSIAKTLARTKQDLIIICPRYEGYDERVTEFVDLQFSIGNYILTGGELPSLIIADSVTRLLNGVLGGELSTELESYQQNDENIEHPHYTRPEEFMGHKVPPTLLSGNHAEIEKWRKANSR